MRWNVISGIAVYITMWCGVRTMHYHYVTKQWDDNDIEDIVPFCCDSCHRDWCRDNGEKYDGWNGCQEGSDYVEYCANCGVVAGGAYICDCQRDNVVVNRILSEHGEQCEHGNWIQLPSERVA